MTWQPLEPVMTIPIMGSTERAKAFSIDQLLAVRREAIEECARIANARYEVMKETEAAHYRLSDTPFNPQAFGFDWAELHESRNIADAIRKLGAET